MKYIRRLLFTFLVFISFSVSVNAESVYLDVGHSISYGSYSTHYFSVDDGSGNAFCVEPSRVNPPSGTYSSTEIGGDLRKALYYSYGAPGWDSAIEQHFINVGLGGDAEDLYAFSHVMLSYVYNSDHQRRKKLSDS